MNFLLTVFLTFIIVLIILLLFVRVGSPVYRLEKKNLIVLMKMVIEGRASENDWQVFLGYPLRHNDELEAVRLRCHEISEREYIGGTGFLLTEKGIEEVKQILSELEDEKGTDQ